jgi:hypothetical protein
MIIMNSVPRTAEDLIASLQAMVQASGGRHSSTVYLKSNQNDCLFVSLEEETLTDGSKVYNIIVR